MKSARRVAVHPWRDPRLFLGIMLVLLSTVIGTKTFAARDNTVDFWSVRSHVSAGDPVSRGDLVSTRIRVPESVAAQYVSVSDEFPAALSELVWSHDVVAGTLVERSALVPTGMRPDAELPLNVSNGSFPTDLRSGDNVDVWVGPAPGQPADDGSKRVLQAVQVLSTGGGSKAIGSSSARTILVGTSANDLGDQTLSAISAGHVTLVRVS